MDERPFGLVFETPFGHYFYETDPKAAQSVFSFVCPCVGKCDVCKGCLCGIVSGSQTVLIGGKNAVSVLNNFGLQTVNYR